MWKVMLQVLVTSWLVLPSQVEPSPLKVVEQTVYRYFSGHFEPREGVCMLNFSVIFPH